MAVSSGLALILLAAGQGSRAGGDVPKQFAKDRHGRTVMAAGADRACADVEWTQVIVVVPPADLDEARASLSHVAWKGAEVVIVAGGPGRLDSLAFGLEAVDAERSPICVVHDGTRPFTPSLIFRSVVDAVLGGEVEAAWPSSRPANTVLSQDSAGLSPVPSSALMVVSTPIAARTDLVLMTVRSRPGSEGALVPLLLAAGARWTTVPDSPLNFKVTTEQDLRDALSLMDREPPGSLGSRRRAYGL